MPQLLGPNGAPIKKPSASAIKRRVVNSGAGRTLWNTATGHLTPWSLGRMLREHAEGNLDEFLSFAEDAEEKNEHYGAVLGTRKRAVEGVDFTIKPAGDSEQDKDIAKFVAEIIDAPNFPDLVEDMLDALGKGFSVSEIIWHTQSNRWTPVDYMHIDPRAFQMAQDNSRELRLRSRDQRAGIELPPYKFITHWSKLKSGKPHRAALARFVGWTYLFQNFTLKDWVGYVETYGQPVRLGRYETGATDEDIAELIRALQNIGSDAAAAIPDSMKMEFIKNAGSGGGGQAFKELAEYCDGRISKAVLGQTMTTDNGSSNAQAKVHDDVRTDIKRADARKLCKTINLCLIRPAIDLNFGGQTSYPSVQAIVLDPEDLKELREAMKDFADMGAQIPQNFVHQRWGIPKAMEGEAVLTPAATRNAARNTALATPVETARIALARASASPDAEDLMDEVLNDGLDGWEPVTAPLIDPVRTAIAGASSYEEAAQALANAYPQMAAVQLARTVRDAMAISRAVGDVID